METNDSGLQKKKAQAQEEGAKKELKARLDKVINHLTRIEGEY
jgi:hypothetical protein